MRCLTALSQQTLAKSQFEIIVVDDGNDKKTKELVMNYCSKEHICHSERSEATHRMVHSEESQNKLTLSYIAMPHCSGPAAARNAGWRMAKAESIAFTDDDTIPDKNWLKEGIKALRQADAVTGKMIVPLPRDPKDSDIALSHIEESEFVTANCFIKKAALYGLGGFDERFRLAWREDSDLHLSLLEHGYNIIHAPKAVVIHPVKNAPWGISLKEQRKAMFNALLYKKHKVLYKTRIQKTPPLVYYAIACSLLVLFLGMVSTNTILTLLAFCSWIFFTTRLFYIRIRNTRKTSSHIVEVFVTSLFIPILAIYWRIKGALFYRVLFV